MTCILTAFEQYCEKHKFGKQWSEDIFPAFAAGYLAGQKAMRKAMEAEERLPKRSRMVYSNLNHRGNPQ